MLKPRSVGAGVSLFALTLAVFPQPPLWGQSAFSSRARVSGDGAEIPHETPESVGMSSAKLAKIRPVVRRLVAEGVYAGATITVIRRGRVVLQESFGWSDIEAREPMRNDSIYRLYSMSKPIASVAAMTLVEEGLLNLDDPVAEHLPEFEGLRVFVGESEQGLELTDLEQPMTIRDLLRHTSGLTYGDISETPVDKLYLDANVLSDTDTLEQTVTKLSKLPLLHQPKADFHYGVSVDVLGAVMQRVSGRPLAEIIQRRVLTPLRMRDTAFHVPGSKVSRLANNYAPREGGRGLRVFDRASDSAFLKPPTLYAAGHGMVSTARDYARFCAMLLNRGELQGARLLKASSVEEMTRNQLPESAYPIAVGADFPGMGFGYGFSVAVEKTPFTYQSPLGEYGWGGLACTDFWVSPKHDLAVIVLAQRQPCSARLRQAVRPLVYKAIEN